MVITASDNTAPSFTAPADIYVCRNTDCTYDINPSATGDVTDEADNCTPGTSLDATYSDDLTNLINCTNSGYVLRTWTLTDAAGNSTMKVQTININPVSFINSVPAANWCNNISNTYTATSSNSTATFAWPRAVVAGISNGAGSGSTATITETLVNTTTEPVIVHYLITPSVNGCAGTTFNLAVMVNPTAVITSAAIANWCNNISNTYTATSASSTATFAWTRAVVAGISNAAGGGSTATITETLDNTTTEPVIVHYLITPSVNGCAGTTLTLQLLLTRQQLSPAQLPPTGAITYRILIQPQARAAPRRLHGHGQLLQASAMQPEAAVQLPSPRPLIIPQRSLS
ncbi:MAG: hypothetical protein IPJ37_02135 [Bacteroidales bacterium]|nr:hypothetical protein [Bacteroidales bacterium]